MLRELFCSTIISLLTSVAKKTKAPLPPYYLRSGNLNVEQMKCAVTKGFPKGHYSSDCKSCVWQTEKNTQIPLFYVATSLTGPLLGWLLLRCINSST